MRRIMFAAVLAAVLFAVRLTAGPPLFEPSEYGFPDSGETVTFSGQVCQKDENSISLKSIYLTENDLNKHQSSAASQTKIPGKEKIICEISDTDEIILGSRVTVTGVFSTYSEASNPGEFDSAGYYQSILTFGKLSAVSILEERTPAFSLREKLYRIKCRWKERIYRIYPEKEATVMSALLLGEKKELDSEWKALYKRNGILHIMSISALHITIIGMGLYRLLRRLGVPVWAAAFAGGLVVVGYGAMTGFGVSACRAIGMFLLRMWAEIAGRTYDMLNALGTVAVVLLIYNPCYLKNSGFLLSFSSILGIGIVYPFLKEAGAQKLVQHRFGESAVKKLGKALADRLKEAWLLGLSVTLTTLPVQLWCYYEVPVYSTLINLFVIPFVKPLMYAGLLAAAFPFPAAFVGIDCLILKWYEVLCSIFDRLPFSVWNPGKPAAWQVAVYYILLAGSLAAPKICLRKKQDAGQEGRKGGQSSENVWEKRMTVMLVIAVGVLGIRPSAQNSILFLDVGQGDCALVRTASGEAYLFDCGSSSRSAVGQYVLLPCLKYYGIRRVDGIFLSHPDADHINGALELLALAEENNLSIGQLVLPDIEERRRSEEYGEIFSEVESIFPDGTLSVRYLGAGDEWNTQSASFLCLHPGTSRNDRDANEYSMCIYASFGDREDPEMTALFTGDVEGEGEAELICELDRLGISRVNVLKVAHHGSKNATSDSFLQQLSPDIAAISCGKNNRYGHPHEELMERLDKSSAYICRTDESGAVHVKAKEGMLEVSAWCGEKEED